MIDASWDHLSQSQCCAHTNVLISVHHDTGSEYLCNLSNGYKITNSRDFESLKICATSLSAKENGLRLCARFSAQCALCIVLSLGVVQCAMKL